MSYNTLWTIPDDLWPQVVLILPPDKPQGTPGRPALPNRQVLNGILYVLRTGCQWKALRTEWFGASSSIHARYQAWVELGVFERLFRLLLMFYDRRRRIQWRWQAIDSKSVAAPLGGEHTGKNGDQHTSELTFDLFRGENSIGSHYLFEEAAWIRNANSVGSERPQTDHSHLRVPHHDGILRPPFQIEKVSRADEIDLCLERGFKSVSP